MRREATDLLDEQRVHASAEGLIMRAERKGRRGIEHAKRAEWDDTLALGQHGTLAEQVRRWLPSDDPHARPQLAGAESIGSLDADGAT